MQLRHLQTFVAIAEAGTLTEAANRLYKTQGAVSHDLKSLEQEFGLVLVDRSGQRAKLTAAGRYLLPHARELLQRTSDIARTMREVGDAGHVEIRVGILPSLCDATIGPIESFRKEHERVSFIVTSALRHELLAGLADGDLDVVVADAAIEHDVTSAEVGVEALGIVVHRRLGADLVEPVRPHAVKHLPFVAFNREIGTTPGADEFFRSVGEFPPTVITVSDQELMRAFVRAEAGYGIMPLAAAGNDDALLKLRTDPQLTRRIVILRHRQRVLAPVASRFYEHIVGSWRTRAAYR